jgi:hypothetical protein
VPSQQGAQSGYQQRPHQLVNVGLDSFNKTEAACLIKASSKPTSLAFLVGTAIPPRCSQNVLGNEWEMFVVLVSMYTVGNVSSMDALSNKSKRMVLPSA